VRTDLRRLRAPELAAGTAGVLLAVALFLPWFEFGGRREDAWHALTVAEIPAALAALGAIALVAVTVTQRSPAVPLAVAVFLVPITAVALIAIAVRAGSPPAGAVDRCYGLWVGLGATVMLLFASVWSLRDERPRRGVAVAG